jgi:hypothetical protein
MAPQAEPLTIEYAYLLISHIAEQPALHVDRKTPLDFVRIHSGQLRELIHWRQLPKVKSLLVRLGIVEISPHAKGERCTGFRLRRPWSNRGLVAVRSIKGSQPAKRLKKAREDRLAPVLPIHEEMIGWLRMLEWIDVAAAHDETVFLTVDNEKQAKAFYSTIALIANKQWFFKPDDSGRCHTNLTLCPRELRKYLTLGGRPLAMVDISACQPFIFANLYLQAGNGGEKYSNTYHNNNYLLYNLSPDSYVFSTPMLHLGNSVLEMLELLGSNRFYSVVRRVGRFKSKKKAKDAVVRWLNDVQQKDYWRLYRTRLAIKQICPELVAFHDGFVQPGEKKAKSFLSYLMQREESEWIIEGVVARLNELYPDMPLLTLHDCVCSWPEYAPIIADMIKEVALERYGFAPHTKIEC